MKHTRIIARALAVVAAIAATSQIFSAMPASAEGVGDPLRVRVLALGDSYTAGVGGGSYEYGPCMRSSNSWATQYVRRLQSQGRDVAINNWACSGATMKDFYNAQKDMGSQQRQLNYVTQDYDVVMLTIGGNDLDFGSVAGLCLAAGAVPIACHHVYDPARDKIYSNTPHGYRSDSNDQSLSEALKSLFLDIAARMHPGARIVYLGYPSLVRTQGSGADTHACVDSKCTITAAAMTALHNPGCSWGLNPPVSSSDLAM